MFLFKEENMKKFRKIMVVILAFAMIVPLFAVSSGAAASYTIVYQDNGGNGGPGIVNYSGTATIPSTEPKKAGMVFRGWATSVENADKGIVAYSSNAQYGGSARYSGNTNIVLYAVWAYSVKLNHGREGWGSEGYQLYKYPAVDLPLYHTRDTVYRNYAMLPGGTGVTNDQRMCIGWSNKQDSVTSKGTGDMYRDYYTKNESATLYCIWGYWIQYYADGGIFPSTGTDKYLTYVCNYDGSNYQNPKTLYGNFDYPMGDLAPVKPGCRLEAQRNGDPFFMLLWSDMRPFTTETPGNNLTIPPIAGGGLDWRNFHTVTNQYGETAIEFYACWEPSITYKANGGQGEDVVDYLNFNWNALFSYDNYQVMTVAQANQHFYKPGCTFLGWNSEPDGSGIDVGCGGIINQMETSDPVTLYAQWTPCNHNYVVVSTQDATCTTGSVTTYQCSKCLETYQTTGDPLGHILTAPDCTTPVFCRICHEQISPALGHDYGEWVTVTEATATTDGLKRRECNRCDDFEEEVIPATGEEPESNVNVSVENYIITFTDASNVNAIRIAPGVLTTAGDIKNAPGCININSGVIASGIDENGNYNYELPDGGVWSVWYKLNDGSQYIVAGLDNNYMTQTVDTYGVTMRVNNLYGVKDFFVAKGHYTTYREVKNADGSFAVTSAKFGAAHSYKYGAAIGDPGEYTICIRYDDSARADVILYFTCEVEYPTVDVFGKNITIGNIDDIRVIRVAPGTFESSHDVKFAEGCRNFNAKTIAELANADGSLTVNNAAAEDGSDNFYTVSVEYKNLYTEIHNITINKIVPEYVVNGNGILFKNMTGLDLLRYAPGDYSSANDIKNANGSQFVKGTNMTGNTLSLDNLNGTYSFLVQYIENSKTIFHVTFD